MTIKQVIPPSVAGTPVKIWTDEVERGAYDQLVNCARLPFIHKHIAVMPDVHWGMGATVGSVIPTRKAIVPAAVGVDIGCGMMAHKIACMTADRLPDNLAPLRASIEAAIPHGRTNNGDLNDKGSWNKENLPKEASESWAWMSKRAEWLNVADQHKHLTRSHNSAWRHLGTLGTGNHFIELCIDQEDGVWIMLHSGSRGVGNAIGRYFIDLAKEEMERWHIHLPDKDLAYLPTGSQHFDSYWNALLWAQEYALMNRTIMMARVKEALRPHFGYVLEASEMAINCHHNYVALENHFGENVYVTRKGAVRARAGDLGIIPGSMGARSFIVRGLGNPESFHSCSHGAGRAMSRSMAKKMFTLEEFAAQTAGVECRKDADVIDEAPLAYKDIDTVMANQSDLVEIVATLKQVLCVKG